MAEYQGQPNYGSLTEYIDVYYHNNAGSSPRKELLFLVNTRAGRNIFEMFNMMAMNNRMLKGGAMHDSLFGSLNKGYFNEEAGAVEAGFGPEGKNLPANNPNRRRYEESSRYSRDNRDYNMREYNRDRDRYYDYDNSNEDNYGQGPGCTPNLDGSRDRRCRESNYQGQQQGSGNPSSGGNENSKIGIDKSLLSNISPLLTR
jgi:hypothetical protein